MTNQTTWKRREILAMAGALAGASAGIRAADDEAILRVGVIGHSGRGDYGHGIDKVWLQIPETRIVAVADPVENGRAKALERLDLKPEAGFESYRDMLSEAKPDIVAIGPRHIDQHRDFAVAAAEAGARGVYLEKPFVRDLAEADAVVEACGKNGTRLAIAHRNRYHPVLPVVRQLVADGEIGRLLEIRARGKEDARGGGLDLWVLGSHLLNLVHYYAGEPVACSAMLYQDGEPATKEMIVEGSEGVGPLAGNEVHARFEMESGIPVFFDSIQNAGTREAGFGIQLVGTEGVIDFRADAEPLAHLRKGSPFRPVSESSPWIPITSAGVGKPEPIEDIRARVGGHQGPARDLIAAIREKRDPLCSARDGRVVVEMTMAVFASHVRNGERVEIPLAVREGNPLARW